MPHPFDAAIALTPAGPGRFTGRTSADYWNFVGPYGGITAAILQQAVLSDPRCQGDPVALTINYCAPIREGEFTVVVDVLRSGKSTQQLSVRMLQPDPNAPHEDQVVVQAMAVNGVRRPLWGHLAAVPPQAPPPEGLDRRPGRAGIRWLERYEARYPRPLLEVPPPGGATLDWVRDDPPRPIDFPSLAALADHFFPTIFALRQKTLPIATVTLNIYFHAGADVLTTIGDDWLLGVSRNPVFDTGFHDAEGQLWHRDRLLLTTQQLVWYRD